MQYPNPTRPQRKRVRGSSAQAGPRSCARLQAGWLNAPIRLTCRDKNANRLKFSVDFLRGLQGAFQVRSAAVGYVKVLLSGGQRWYVANLTQTDTEVTIRGEVPGTTKKVDLIVNTRVEMSPEDLEHLVRNRLAELCREYGFDTKVLCSALISW